MKKLWNNYSLSILLWSQFIISTLLYMWGSYSHWVETGSEGSLVWIWLSDIMENWQSEAMQIAIFVWITVGHKHKDSPQSRDGNDEMKADIKEIKRLVSGEYK